ncbi:MAG TPA: glycosyltransferase [Anaerolineae bacterium]|nr:glycosyltransferase [Anaerolineae bacterium]HOQ99407.1 glycosyltransferase [Anaerolineae bacterium]HPL27811.1 glycosyltransferase [Anaerolineae bacterium]
MRILFAGQTYRPPRNGAAVFGIGLAEGLAAAGHEVAVLVPSDRGRAYEAEHGGVRIYALAALSLAPFYAEIHVTLRPQAAVGRLLDALQPQVVHIQDHYPLSRAVAQAARARGLPLVGTNNFLPDNMIPQLPFPASRTLVERLLWAMVLEVMNRAAVVTAVSETSAAVLRRQGLRVPALAISAGVDLQRFAPDSAIDRAGVRRRYGLDPERPLFLYVGRVDGDKRLDVLLRALALAGRGDVQLAIAGRGRALPALTALAARLGLGGRAVFAGYVPEADLVPLLNSADVFAMPSEVELQSIATLEAMATGRPVLAAAARALPELVHDGANGYLFRPGDAADAARGIARLCDERARWPAMGAQSLAIASGHAVERTIARYEQLYRELAGAAAPSR